MSSSQVAAAASRKPLRLWPGVVIATLALLARFVVPLFAPHLLAYGVVGGVFIAVPAIALWWLFFSRAPWSERLGGLALMAAVVFAASRLVDRSIATGGMGFLFYVLAVPLVACAFVAWAVATRRLEGRARWLTMAAALALACAPWTLIRTGGFSSDFKNDFAWRWSRSPEERLLVQDVEEPAPPAPSPMASAAAQAPAPAVVAAGRPSGRHPRRRWPPRPRPRRRRKPCGRASADRSATAWCAACGSRPIGALRRPSRCGGGRSARPGRRSPSRATSSIPRSSAARTRWSLATTPPPASPCGDTATRRGSGNRTAAPARARRRRCTTAACTRWAGRAS